MFHHVSRVHRANHDFLYAAPALLLGIDELSPNRLTDLAERSICQQRLRGNCAEQLEAKSLQSLLRELTHVIVLLWDELIEDDSNDFDAFLIEKRFVQREFIDRTTDTALGHQHHF